MINFINNIIYLSMTNVLIVEKTSSKALLASWNKTNKKFALKWYIDSNVIASRVQVYSFLYKITCFKYSHFDSKISIWFFLSLH